MIFDVKIFSIFAQEEAHPVLTSEHALSVYLNG
jgi:hypothetical protein